MEYKVKLFYVKIKKYISITKLCKLVLVNITVSLSYFNDNCCLFLVTPNHSDLCLSSLKQLLDDQKSENVSLTRNYNKLICEKVKWCQEKNYLSGKIKKLKKKRKTKTKLVLICKL